MSAANHPDPDADTRLAEMCRVFECMAVSPGGIPRRRGQLATPMPEPVDDFTPDYATHPGETLDEFMQKQGLSSVQVSALTGLTQKEVFQLVGAKINVTPDIAAKLGKAMASAEFWLALQANHTRATHIVIHPDKFRELQAAHEIRQQPDTKGGLEYFYQGRRVILDDPPPQLDTLAEK